MSKKKSSQGNGLKALLIAFIISPLDDLLLAFLAVYLYSMGEEMVSVLIILALLLLINLDKITKLVKRSWKKL